MIAGYAMQLRCNFFSFFSCLCLSVCLHCKYFSPVMEEIHLSIAAWEDFRLDIWKIFCTEKVVEHRKRLPREVIGLPELEGFNICVDVVLRVKWWT